MAFQGYQVIANGFEVTHGQVQEFVTTDPQSEEVLVPFVNGDTLHDHASIEPRRWMMDFGTRSEAEAAQYRPVFAYAQSAVKSEVEEKAAPSATGKKSSYEQWAERWWTYWSPRSGLRTALK